MSADPYPFEQVQEWVADAVREEEASRPGYQTHFSFRMILALAIVKVVPDTLFATLTAQKVEDDAPGVVPATNLQFFAAEYQGRLLGPDGEVESAVIGQLLMEDCWDVMCARSQPPPLPALRINRALASIDEIEQLVASVGEAPLAEKIARRMRSQFEATDLRRDTPNVPATGQRRM